ncbi:MAG: hypothetical protein ABIK76_05560, partial [candidate division WOR-3 bacterium]
MPFRKFYIFVLLLLFCKKIEIEKWQRKIYAFSILNPKDIHIKCFVDSNYSIERKIEKKGIADASVFLINEDEKETLK